MCHSLAIVTERTRNERMLAHASRPIARFDVAYEPLVPKGLDFYFMQQADPVLHQLLVTAKFLARAKSYRGFAVAAGLTVMDGTRVGRVLGYNIKLDETDDVNIHAEELAHTKATQLRYNHIPVVTVLGNPQPDKVTGRMLATLPPCG